MPGRDPWLSSQDYVDEDSQLRDSTGFAPVFPWRRSLTRRHRAYSLCVKVRGEFNRRWVSSHLVVNGVNQAFGVVARPATLV